jgi:hypothetical protein
MVSGRSVVKRLEGGGIVLNSPASEQPKSAITRYVARREDLPWLPPKICDHFASPIVSQHNGFWRADTGAVSKLEVARPA